MTADAPLANPHPAYDTLVRAYRSAGMAVPDGVAVESRHAMADPVPTDPTPCTPSPWFAPPPEGGDDV